MVPTLHLHHRYYCLELWVVLVSHLSQVFRLRHIHGFTLLFTIKLQTKVKNRTSNDQVWGRAPEPALLSGLPVWLEMITLDGGPGMGMGHSRFADSDPERGDESCCRPHLG